MFERWAAWFAVDGDLRFLSHHDMMRLMERAAARANLPLRYSEGFNPRPKLWLPLPRPVGVASRCELMVVELAGDADGAFPAGDLGAQFPPGAKLLRVEPVPAGHLPQVTSARYELALRRAELPGVTKRLDELGGMERWEIRRRPRHKGRPAGTGEVTVDIKPGVLSLTLEGEVLSFALAHGPSGSVRCLDLLALVGLAEPAEDAREDAPRGAEVLARVLRTEIECEL